MPELVLSAENTPTYTVAIGPNTYSFDPISVVLKMQQLGIMAADGNMGSDLGKVISSIREVFGIKELGDSQTLVLAKSFQAYIEDLQKKMGLTPTSSAPTVPGAASFPQKNA